MPEINEKGTLFRVLQSISRWLWRVATSASLGGIALTTIVPWAQAQRGYPALGGECLLVIAAFILPLCLFRRV